MKRNRRVAGALVALALAACGASDDPERAEALEQAPATASEPAEPAVIERSTYGDVEILYLDAPPPAIGAAVSEIPHSATENNARWRALQEAARASGATLEVPEVWWGGRRADERRAIGRIAFGPWYHHVGVQLGVCLGDGRPEVATVHLVEYGDVGCPIALPAPRGRVSIHREGPAALRFTLDLRSADGGARYRAHGLLDLERCAPLEPTDYLASDHHPVPAPACAP